MGPKIKEGNYYVSIGVRCLFIFYYIASIYENDCMGIWFRNGFNGKWNYRKTYGYITGLDNFDTTDWTKDEMCPDDPRLKGVTADKNCHCGAQSCNSNIHSPWCPKYTP